MKTTPKMHRVAAGDYETADGRFRMYQIPGCYPPAWNVEDVVFDAIVDFDHDSGYDGMIVDGAATKRDAMAIFAEWYQEHA